MREFLPDRRQFATDARGGTLGEERAIWSLWQGALPSEWKRLLPRRFHSNAPGFWGIRSNGETCQFQSAAGGGNGRIMYFHAQKYSYTAWLLFLLSASLLQQLVTHECRFASKNNCCARVVRLTFTATDHGRKGTMPNAP